MTKIDIPPPSFRKIFLRALSCAKENLCGIRFVSLVGRKPNRIPDKLAFLRGAKKRLFRNDENYQYWRNTIRQFFKFGIVGAVGFIVDTAMLYIGIELLGLGRIAAGMFSFPFAVTSTWIGNRVYTFPEAMPMSAMRQLTKFAVVCAIGLVFNRGTYSLLVSTIPFVYDYPVIGLLGGTAAGMFFNFFAARRLVFGM
ncbi:MAG: GtrA family protein [Bdellovibrionales bacterium]